MYMELFTGAFLVAQVSLIIVAKPFYAIFFVHLVYCLHRFTLLSIVRQLKLSRIKGKELILLSLCSAKKNTEIL